jgi:LacI family transcriptional regulator
LLCNSDEDPEKEQLYIDVLVRERVAGIIIVPSHEDTCQSLSKLKIPIVVVDRRLKCLKTDSVVLDNIYGSQIATRHLLHLGHRRIGLVGAPHNVSVGLDRQRGYEKALEEYGIPVDGALIEIGNFKEEGGYNAARKLLEMNNRPTALFAVNSLMTMGMLHAINELNLRIPDDISVIGFDDMPWLSLLNPPLTAVSQPVYEIGTKASELLFDRIFGNIDRPIESIVMNPELRLRASTRKLLKN